MVYKPADASPPGIELYANAFFALRMDYPRRILWLLRSAREFAAVEDIEGCIQALARAVPTERRKNLAILSDMREGPIRVKPALDPAHARYRTETERGFMCAAVVVQSALGKVRAVRLAEERGGRVAIVETVEQGLAHIAQRRLASVDPAAR